ncbi:MAG: hypothetical protein M3488_13110, partial [Actinomycetota bacterium]|nr:hypothetical protein [Actinomycetota bacterium]
FRRQRRVDPIATIPTACLRRQPTLRVPFPIEGARAEPATTTNRETGDIAAALKLPNVTSHLDSS